MGRSKSIRSLIDKYFSLQWCRDNLVVPLQVESSLPPNPSKIIIAIGNFQYLGTIANIIKERVKDFDCFFIERNPDEINKLLDQAANEKLNLGEGIQISEFSEDAVLSALKDSSSDDNEEGFSLEFDDFIEEHIE